MTSGRSHASDDAAPGREPDRRHLRPAGRSRRALVVVCVVALGLLAGSLTALASRPGVDEGQRAAPASASPVADAPAPTTAAPVPTVAPTTVATSAPTPTLPPGLTQADVDAGLLGTHVASSASGELVTVRGSTKNPKVGTVHRVRVEVEKGLPVDPEKFAAFVMATLNDPRGWGADGSLSFVRTDKTADIRVVLASPHEVDQMCAPLATDGQVSCGRGGHAAINFKRWVKATAEFDDLTVYRHYVVSHEVGHLLGHPHRQCPGKGKLAPVMQQQTYQVAPCLPNAWPHPGAER